MHLLTSDQLKKNDIMYIFNSIDSIKQYNVYGNNVKYGNNILINVFYEYSTRTSLSFECAMNKLGGKVITFNKEFSSVHKGETFEDTIRTLMCYGDIMVIRHPEKGIVNKIAEISSIPIINGGDGNNEHPSQSLLDLYTIYKKYANNFINKTILFVGDILNSRTIHSLIKIINLYPTMKILFLPFSHLDPSKEMIKNIKNIHNQSGNIVLNMHNINYNEIDIVYCTRLQKERLEDKNISLNEDIIINKAFVNKLKKDAIIMHPLPRGKELDIDVDSNNRAYYFKQMEYGVELRMSIINYCLNN
tara:strand:- start:118 stop:1026 length:909 start_codon:yes stop_codon:yes gene_type:complete